MPPGFTSTILVVDDNLGARRSIEALLARNDYRFLLAESGGEALQILEAHTPDVILLDVMMPGMSGYDVCRKIRENARISEIPVIMITALDDEESMIQGIDAGADDFLSKPISKIELRSRVSSILRLNRFRKLCDERQKFEIVVTHSRFGYIVLDNLQRIKFANSAASSILELGDTQTSEPDFFHVAQANFTLQPRDAESAFREEQDAGSREPFLLVRPKRLDRSARWIRVSILAFGSNSSEQVLLKLEDITDKIVSFQEKHTFSRMITHKLLTPLNAIKAANQILSESRPSSERLAQVVDLQQQGIARLEYDIHSILGFLESSKTEHAATPVSETLELLERVARSLPFPFTIDPSPEVALESAVGISQHSFEACIREIVENAIKFKNGAEPEIHCRIRLAPDGQSLSYTFKNNSQKLREAELANAWKPYWQADRYFTGEIPGMGLGLSLIAANIWSAGGNCHIENNDEGDGVIITLSFPLSKK